jgi:hypothetical protein
MDNLFHLFPEKAVFAKGLEDSQIRWPGSILRCSCWYTPEISKSVAFKLIYSIYPAEKKLRPIPDMDIRYKAFLCVIQVDRRLTSYVTSSKGLKLHSTEPSSSRNILSVADLFPIELLIFPSSFRDERSCRCESINFSLQNSCKYDILEIYEIVPQFENFEIFPVVGSVDSDGSIATPKVAVAERDNIGLLFDLLKARENNLKKGKLSLENQLLSMDKEADFVAEYLYKTWMVKGDYDNKSRFKILQNILEKKETYESALKMKKRKRTTQNDEEPVLDSLDPIVYFNVEGEIFSILRSTILRVIPDSQLAVRVSGRWEEQVEKGDIDEEGNLIVHCHKESFRQILAALQLNHNNPHKLVIYVNKMCRDLIEETLNYLLIVPALLISMD